MDVYGERYSWKARAIEAENAVLCPSGLPAGTTSQTAQTGAVAGDDRCHSGRRQNPAHQTAAHAKRIFDRLREEHGYTGGYTIAKDYVQNK